MLSLGRGQIIAASFLLVSAAIAHGAVSPQRILRPVDTSEVSALPNNVHPWASRATDLGPASADKPLTELALRFNMTAEQQAELNQLLSDQQNPASPRYHQWLTPEQFGAEFGLAAADLQKVSDWLTSQGFTVTEVARGRSFIKFSGTVGQVTSAFHTQIHNLSLDGESHFGNLTTPVLPSAIAAVTASVTGLHDFSPKPYLRHVSSDAVPDVSGVAPRLTSAASGNHYVAPGDFYTIYDETPLLTAGTPINGAGVTIAVVGQIDINMSDLAAFRSVSGLPANSPTVVLTGTDPGQPGTTQGTNNLLESELDLEWSGATAPSANILFYTGKDVFNNSLTRAINDNKAAIISVSYGECESVAQSSGDLNTFYPLIQQANAQGQTVVASSGDSGATDCDTGAVATSGYAVDFPSLLPNVTAIGGTMFNDAGGSYWGATNGNNATALGYIPELPWNEDSSTGLSAGGGGASTNFTKPAWQVGTGVPADSSRDVPDISFNAASGATHDPTLICTPGYCADGYKSSPAETFDVVGGTSVGTPQFAGLLALVEQKTGGRIGNANPTIYALANSSFYSSVFHDVTSGNNSSPCTAGTTNCPAGGTIGYTAGVGYDLATGWGSVDAFQMVTNWSSVTPIVSTIGQAASSTTLTGVSASPITQGTNVNLMATVTSGATGTVQFLLDNVAQGSPVLLSGGIAAYTLSTTTIPYGPHTVQAAYSGDATYAGSKGFANMIIASSGVPDFTLTPATTTASASAGGTSAGVIFTVTGLNSFTGTVQLSASTPSSATYLFSPGSVLLSNTKTSGTATLTLGAFAAAKTTTVSTASSRHQNPPWYEAGSGVALAGILMLVLPKRRRFIGALVAVLSIGMLAATGCGGVGNTTSTSVASPPTPAGMYTVTVTASGTSNATVVTHTATVTFTVQ